MKLTHARNTHPWLTKRGAGSIAAAAAMLVAATSSMAVPTFASTTAAVGGTDLVWDVAAEHGGYNEGLARFGHILGNVAFNDAWAWRHEGPVTMLANNASGSNGGIYTYFIFRQTFDLTGYDPATADLKFRWASDDVPGAVGWTPAYKLNGAALQAGSSGAYALGSVVEVDSGFVAGHNSIDFYVEGNGTTDGFALETVSFTANAVPEPETYALMLAGLAGIGWAARRKAR